MLTAGHSVLPLSFRSFFLSFFSPPNLGGRLADRHQTLPTLFELQNSVRNLGAPLPEIWRPQNIKISARFRTTSRLDRECLRNATRHRQSENGVANSHTPAKANLAQAKHRTGVLTHPIGSHQVGHCHASSCIVWSL